MKYLNILLILSAITLYFTTSASAIVRCGVVSPLPAQQASIESALSGYRSSLGLSSSRTTFAQVDIPVNFNIVLATGGAGAVTNDELIDQIEVLNDAYADQHVHFYLNAVKTVTNNSWSNHESDSDEEEEMKETLSERPERILNVYICYAPRDDDGNILLGYATFPWMYAEDSFMHGVVVIYDSLPEGSDGGVFDEGDTLTHEVGHYLGLYHVHSDFGTCVEDYDYCSDTPACLVSFGQPSETKDTCTGFDGYDPVHNFMGYVDDDWMDEFTDDQRTRAFDLSAMDKPTMSAEAYLWAGDDWGESGGWRQSGWLQDWVETTNLLWIYHNAHGWMYTTATSTSNAWFYTSDLGWLRIGLNYPWIYRQSINDWWWYQVSSYSPRWFYSSNQQEWISIGSSSQRGPDPQ